MTERERERGALPAEPDAREAALEADGDRRDERQGVGGDGLGNLKDHALGRHGWRAPRGVEAKDEERGGCESVRGREGGREALSAHADLYVHTSSSPGGTPLSTSQGPPWTIAACWIDAGCHATRSSDAEAVSTPRRLACSA